MTDELTNARKVLRYYKLGERFNSVVTAHNDLSAKLFKAISSFSTLLPDHLNTLSTLSDMITDALVITGKSSLSKSITELVQESNGLSYNADTGSLTLDYLVQYTVPFKNKTSVIQTDISYNAFTIDKSGLASFNDLLSGTPITLQTNAQNFRYTFCLDFSNKVDVNSVLLKLNKDTDSYPLISEIYYINSENKREYITILNSFDTKYDLDDNRVKDNTYNILFDTIKANRIYMTLEDREKAELSIDKISVRKLKFATTGSIVFGPIVSTFPILKAALEANGDISNASFYLSYDKSNWIQVVLPNDISQSKNLNKIVSFNTINNNSVKVATDVKELYLKVELDQKKVLNEEENLLNRSLDFYANTLAYPAEEKPINVSAYLTTSETFYGDRTYVQTTQASKLREAEHSYILSNSSYKVKSFVQNVYGYGDTESLNDVYTVSLLKKVNGDRVDARGFNPLTSTVYGYTVNKVKKTCNTNFEESVVLLLSKAYSRDIYTVRQNNKELKIDLSSGYIDSCINGVLGVAEIGVVDLYDSTGRLLKELTIRKFNDFNYISLVEEGFFELPEMGALETKTLNPLYPLRLNEESEYGILDNKLVCVKTLLDFEEISTLTKEEILSELHISKENGNYLELTDKVLKEKYTEQTTETVAAYSDSRAIKLKNKHIQKGSLRISVS